MMCLEQDGPSGDNISFVHIVFVVLAQVTEQTADSSDGNIMFIIIYQRWSVCTRFHLLAVLRAVPIGHKLTVSACSSIPSIGSS